VGGIKTTPRALELLVSGACSQDRRLVNYNDHSKTGSFSVRSRFCPIEYKIYLMQVLLLGKGYKVFRLFWHHLPDY
jgi:hypothetical protein